MSNNLLFFLFSTVFLVSSAFPIAETAVNVTSFDEGLASKWFMSFGTEGCQKDKIKFFECARKTLNHTTVLGNNSDAVTSNLLKISDCMGEVSCGPMAFGIYVIRSKNFQKECESTAAECIESSNIEHVRDYCNSEMSPMNLDNQSLKIHVARCVAARLNELICNEKDRSLIVRAEFARLDLEEVMKTLKGKDGNPNMTAFINFDKKFDAKAYSHIM